MLQMVAKKRNNTQKTNIWWWVDGDLTWLDRKNSPERNPRSLPQRIHATCTYIYLRLAQTSTKMKAFHPYNPGMLYLHISTYIYDIFSHVFSPHLYLENPGPGSFSPVTASAKGQATAANMARRPCFNSACRPQFQVGTLQMLMVQGSLYWLIIRYYNVLYIQTVVGNGMSEPSTVSNMICPPLLVAGFWTNPFEKYAVVKMGSSSPKFGLKIKMSFENHHRRWLLINPIFSWVGFHTLYQTTNQGEYCSISSWWFQAIWKICSSNWIT